MKRRDEPYIEKEPTEGTPFLFCRTVNKPKMENATNKVINLLRKELGLEPWECYFVLDTLIKSIPGYTDFQHMEFIQTFGE